MNHFTLLDKKDSGMLINIKDNLSKITKGVLNINLGVASKNDLIFKSAITSLREISGQHPVIVISRKDLSEFKIKRGDIIGLKVTLRRQKLSAFVERLILIYLPRLKDFKGIPLEKVSKSGNLTIGFMNCNLFPEIPETTKIQSFGISVTLCVKSDSLNNAKLFLKKVGFPLLSK